jgi:probable rRNA maturation factor
MSAKIKVINKSKSTLPSVDFDLIAKEILGNKYELNIIFIEDDEMEKLNLIYRNKKCTTDILSFPISETVGEIYISPKESRMQMKKFEREYDNFIAFLFIHGCVHLKGYDHGGKMESIEKKVREKFGI